MEHPLLYFLNSLTFRDRTRQPFFVADDRLNPDKTIKYQRRQMGFALPTTEEQSMVVYRRWTDNLD